jgi:DNA gyrase subunit A
LQPEETVSSMMNVSKTHNAANLIMCTKRGTVKKTPFEQYQNVRSNGLIAINLDNGDELKWIRMTTGDNEVVISTAQGQAIRFHEKGARPMGRVARGVRGIRLRQGDEVIGMDIVEEGADIFVISKYGYGKRTSIDQFTPHARGGVGIRSAVVNDKTGDLVSVKRLDASDGQEVIIISRNGQTIRLGLKDIPALGRATQGVRIMRLNDGDEVVSLTLVDKVEEGDDEADSEAPAAAGSAAGAGKGDAQTELIDDEKPAKAAKPAAKPAKKPAPKKQPPKKK